MRRRHGAAAVAVALKLYYKSLKRALTTGSTSGDAPCTPASPDFVELDLGLRGFSRRYGGMMGYAAYP